MRQVDFDGVGKQGRRNNKNDQQHQHDVDQRHHVDFRHGVVAAPVLEASESHDPYPLPVAASVTCRALPVVSPTGWPVVRKVNRSWAKAPRRARSTLLIPTNPLSASTAGIELETSESREKVDRNK